MQTIIPAPPRTSCAFYEALPQYFRPGQRAAELYHGEHLDILAELSLIAGPEGIVFGVDQHNKPNPILFNADKLKRHCPNVHLIGAKVPPLPPEIAQLHAMVVRQFVWSYDLSDPERGVQHDPAVYKAMQAAIAPSGFLILHLDKWERDMWASTYERTIKNHLPAFTKVPQGCIEALVYRKTP